MKNFKLLCLIWWASTQLCWIAHASNVVGAMATGLIHGYRAVTGDRRKPNPNPVINPTPTYPRPIPTGQNEPPVRWIDSLNQRRGFFVPPSDEPNFVEIRHDTGNVEPSGSSNSPADELAFPNVIPPWELARSVPRTPEERLRQVLFGHPNGPNHNPPGSQGYYAGEINPYDSANYYSHDIIADLFNSMHQINIEVPFPKKDKEWEQLDSILHWSQLFTDQVIKRIEREALESLACRGDTACIDPHLLRALKAYQQLILQLQTTKAARRALKAAKSEDDEDGPRVEEVFSDDDGDKVEKPSIMPVVENWDPDSDGEFPENPDLLEEGVPEPFIGEELPIVPSTPQKSIAIRAELELNLKLEIERQEELIKKLFNMLKSVHSTLRKCGDDDVCVRDELLGLIDIPPNVLAPVLAGSDEIPVPTDLGQYQNLFNGLVAELEHIQKDSRGAAEFKERLFKALDLHGENQDAIKAIELQKQRLEVCSKEISRKTFTIEELTQKNKKLQSEKAQIQSDLEKSQAEQQQTLQQMKGLQSQLESANFQWNEVNEENKSLRLQKSQAERNHQQAVKDLESQVARDSKEFKTQLGALNARYEEESKALQESLTASDEQLSVAQANLQSLRNAHQKLTEENQARKLSEVELLQKLKANTEHINALQIQVKHLIEERDTANALVKDRNAALEEAVVQREALMKKLEQNQKTLEENQVVHKRELINASMREGTLQSQVLIFKNGWEAAKQKVEALEKVKAGLLYDLNKMNAEHKHKLQELANAKVKDSEAHEAEVARLTQAHKKAAGKLQKELQTKTTEFEKAQETINTLKKANDTLWEQIDVTTTAKEKAEHNLETIKLVKADVDATLEAMKKENAELNSSILGLKKESSELDLQKRQAESKLEQATSNIGYLTLQLEQTNDKVHARGEIMEQLKAKLKDSTEEHARAMSELEKSGQADREEFIRDKIDLMNKCHQETEALALKLNKVKEKAEESKKLARAQEFALQKLQKEKENLESNLIEIAQQSKESKELLAQEFDAKMADLASVYKQKQAELKERLMHENEESLVPLKNVIEKMSGNLKSLSEQKAEVERQLDSTKVDLERLNLELKSRDSKIAELEEAEKTLGASVKDKERAIFNAQSELAAAKIQIADLQKRQEEIMQAAFDMQDGIMHLEADMKESQRIELAKIESLRQKDTKKYNLEMQKLEKALQSKQAAIDEKRRHLAESQQTVADQNGKLRRLNQQVEKLNSQISSLDGDLKSVKEQAEVLKAEIAKKDKALEDAAAHSAVLSQQIEAQKKQLEQTEAEGRKKFDELREVEEERRRAILKLENANNAHSKELHQLTNQLKNAMSEKLAQQQFDEARLKEQIAAGENTAKALENVQRELAETKESLSNLEEIKEQLETERHSLKSLVSHAATEVKISQDMFRTARTRLETEFKKIQAKMSQQQLDKRELESKFGITQEQLQASEKAVAEFKKTDAELRAKLGRLEKERNDLKNKLGELKEEQSKLQQQLIEVTESRDKYQQAALGERTLKQQAQETASSQAKEIESLLAEQASIKKSEGELKEALDKANARASQLEAQIRKASDTPSCSIPYHQKLEEELEALRNKMDAESKRLGAELADAHDRLSAQEIATMEEKFNALDKHSKLAHEFNATLEALSRNDVSDKAQQELVDHLSAEISKLRSAAKSSGFENITLSFALDRVETELADLKARMVEKEKILAEKEERIRNAQADLYRVNSEKADIELEYSKLRTASGLTEEQLNLLKKSEDNLKHALEQTKNALATQQSENAQAINDLNERIGKAGEEIDRAKSQASILILEKKRILQELGAGEKEGILGRVEFIKMELEALVNEKTQNVSDLQSELDQRISELASKDQSIESQKQAISTLEARIQSLGQLMKQAADVHREEFAQQKSRLTDELTALELEHQKKAGELDDRIAELVLSLNQVTEEKRLLTEKLDQATAAEENLSKALKKVNEKFDAEHNLLVQAESALTRTKVNLDQATERSEEAGNKAADLQIQLASVKVEADDAIDTLADVFNGVSDFIEDLRKTAEGFFPGSGLSFKRVKGLENFGSALRTVTIEYERVLQFMIMQNLNIDKFNNEIDRLEAEQAQIMQIIQSTLTLSDPVDFDTLQDRLSQYVELQTDNLAEVEQKRKEASERSDELLTQLQKAVQELSDEKDLHEDARAKLKVALERNMVDHIVISNLLSDLQSMNAKNQVLSTDLNTKVAECQQLASYLAASQSSETDAGNEIIRLTLVIARIRLQLQSAESQIQAKDRISSDVRRQLVCARRDNEALSARVRDLTGGVNALERERDVLVRRNTELNQDLARLQGVEQALQDAQRRLGEATANEQVYEARVRDLERDLNDLQFRNGLLTNEVAGLNTRIQELQAEESRLNQSYRVLQAQRNRLIEDASQSNDAQNQSQVTIARLHAIIAAHQQAIRQRSTEVDGLLRELNRKQTELQQNTVRIDELNEKVLDLEEHARIQRTRKRDYKRRKNELEEQVRQSENTLQAVETERDQFRNAQGQTWNELNRVTADYDRVQRQLVQVTVARDQAVRDSLAEQAQVARLQQQIAQLTADNQNLQQDQAQQQAQNQNLLQVQAQQQAQIAQQEAQIDQQEAQNAQQQAQIAQLQAQNVQLQAQNVQLQAQNAQQQAQIAGLPQISQLRAQIAQDQAEIARLQRELARLRAQPPVNPAVSPNPLANPVVPPQPPIAPVAPPATVPQDVHDALAAHLALVQQQLNDALAAAPAGVPQAAYDDLAADLARVQQQLANALAAAPAAPAERVRSYSAPEVVTVVEKQAECKCPTPREEALEVLKAERAKLLEGCDRVKAANIGLFSAGMLLFTGSAGFVGYWFMRLRPAMAAAPAA